jgi:hypothetical protein
MGELTRKNVICGGVRATAPELATHASSSAKRRRCAIAAASGSRRQAPGAAALVHMAGCCCAAAPSHTVESRNFDQRTQCQKTPSAADWLQLKQLGCHRGWSATVANAVQQYRVRRTVQDLCQDIDTRVCVVL